MKKPKERQGKIIFIDAKDELKDERTNAWLEPRHIKNIIDVYKSLDEIKGFSKVVQNSDVIANNSNLNIQLYVRPIETINLNNINDLITEIKETQESTNQCLNGLFSKLKFIGISND